MIISSKFNCHSNSNFISNSKLISNYFGQQLQLFRLASLFVNGKGAGWFVIVHCNHVNACPGCRGTRVVALPLTNILGTHIAHLAGTCPGPFNRYTYSSQGKGCFGQNKAARPWAKCLTQSVGCGAAVREAEKTTNWRANLSSNAFDKCEIRVRSLKYGFMSTGLAGGWCRTVQLSSLVLVHPLSLSD